MQHRFHRSGFIGAIAAFCLTLAGAAGPASADEFEWTDDVSGFWSTAGNWTRLSGTGSAPPGVNDLAWFNEPFVPDKPGQFYTEIELSSSAFCAELRVSNSARVHLLSGTFADQNIFITSGAADMNINGSAAVRIGDDNDFNSIGTTNVFVNDSLNISGNSGLVVEEDAYLTVGTLNVGGFGDGDLTLNNAEMDLLGPGPHMIGAASVGTLDLAGSTTIVGLLHIAPAVFTNSTGIVEFPGGTVESEDIIIGGGPSDVSSGLLDIEGGAWTMQGASTLTIGGPAGTGTGELRATLVTGFQLVEFTTGAGLTTINNTGAMELLDDVEFTFGGDLLIDGGTFTQDANAVVNYDANGTVTAQNGATVNLTGLDVENLITVDINTGSSWTTDTINIGTFGQGTINVSGLGTTLSQRLGHTLTVGNTGVASALLSITSNAAAQTSDGLTTINNTGAVEVFSGASLNLRGDLLIDSGLLDATGGMVTFDPNITVDIQNGGVFTTDMVSLPVADGTLINLLPGGELIASNTVALNLGGTLRLDGGAATLGDLVISEGNLDFISGTLDLGGDFTLDNDLVLSSERTLAVGGTTTLFGPASLVIDGGAYTGNALNLFAGASFVRLSGEGMATVTGPVFAAGGSVIETEDELTLGDAKAVNGFYCNGTIFTNNNAIILNDANRAVFDSGSLVVIGESGLTGALEALNGITIDFGANIVGHGSIDTPDDLATPVVSNGSVLGDAATEPITLTGYVTGVGDFDNVIFNGTYAPGFSPASIVTGSTTYAGTLRIELGGASPGSQHDQINHILADATATLGGTLQVTLIDGFQPSIGDEFVIITADSITGQFAAYDGPANLEVIYEPTRVLLGVTGSCPADIANSDGLVNVFDLLALLAGWGADGAGADLAEPNDIVNVFDLLALLAAWGSC